MLPNSTFSRAVFAVTQKKYIFLFIKKSFKQKKKAIFFKNDVHSHANKCDRKTA